MRPGPDQATGILLAAALHRLGGSIELSREEQRELAEAYGEPSPVLMGQDERGMFAALYSLDDLEEKGWPHYQRLAGGDCTEEQARLTLRETVRHLRATQRLREELVEALRQRVSDERN